MNITHVGRFSTREQAEMYRPSFERAHGEALGKLLPVDHPDFAGEYTLRVVGATADIKNAPAEEQRTKFDLIPAAKFLQHARPRWFIKGVLPEAQLGAVVGEPGAGKSPFMYSMAAAIHRGAEWYGHRVRKGRAVYLVAEGAADFRNRIDAYCKEFGVKPADLPPMIDDVPNLKTSADATLLAKKIGKADVLFLDTFAASFIGDECSGADVGLVLAHCKFISEQTGAMVFLAAHPGKDLSKGLRGWSGTLAALDTEITITKQGDFRNVEITKQKGGAEGPLFDFKIKVHDLGRDEDGDPITSVVIEPCEESQPRVDVRKIPHGKYVDEIMLVLRRAGKPVDVDLTRDGVISKFPRGAGRTDNRKSSFDRALKNLVEAGSVQTVEDSDGKLIQTPVKQAVETDWLN